MDFLLFYFKISFKRYCWTNPNKIVELWYQWINTATANYETFNLIDACKQPKIRMMPRMTKSKIYPAKLKQMPNLTKQSTNRVCLFISKSFSFQYLKAFRKESLPQTYKVWK